MKKLLTPRNILVTILILGAFLRIYKLSVSPPSLFGDELDLGYHAYSVLLTGKDYQGNFLPVNFHSLAEWRTPLYIYSAIPTVGLFGISPLGVRLPAAIFGFLCIYTTYLLIKKILDMSGNNTENETVGLIGAGLTAISPWAIQYSRAGFEVTEMLFFLTLGVYLFLKSLTSKKLLWLSVICLIATAWTYSTAKLFTPALMILMLGVFKKEIFSQPRKELLKAVLAGLIVGIPLIYGVFFGGGTQRFSYISIFSDPTTESNVGFAREREGRIRGLTGTGLSPSFSDKFFYNKFTYWGDILIKNYLSAFSTQFLFIKGDPNPRQSVGMGEFYRIEIIALIVGVAYFFFYQKVARKVKWLLFSWIVLGAVPAALTVGGENHATRLILLLPPFLLLISYGWLGFFEIFKKNHKLITVLFVTGLYILSFIFYIHEYFGPYRLTSERWWHYGWGEAVHEIKSIDKNYDKVVISMTGEPAWIFFAAYYQYPPADWQVNYPIGKDVELTGFGKVSHINKYYFGSPDKNIQIYGLGKLIDSKTLYLANANEVGENLIMHPERSPEGLKLIKTVAYPSGEPSMYLFAGTK